MRRWGLATAVVGLACAASIAAWRVAVFTTSIATELDRESALTSIAPRPQSTIVFDRHGKPAFTFFIEQRIFGEGYCGVEAASRGYFGKSAADLSLADAALLAALVRSPSVDAPCVSRLRATRRRDLVLALMRNQGRINVADFQTAAATAVPGESHKDAAAGLRAAGGGSGLYFQEELRRQLFQMFGADRVLRGGLRVYSTYDPDLQIEAERAIAKRIEQIAGARKAARELQGSLVSMSPESGDDYAIVGGRDFRESSFNRAIQARRQAGSAFKPIIYVAALERGFAPGTLLRDLPPERDAGRAALRGGNAWLPGVARAADRNGQ